MQNQLSTHTIPNAIAADSTALVLRNSARNTQEHAVVAEGAVPAPRDAVQELGALQNPLQRSITPGIIAGGVALTAATAGGIYLMSKSLGRLYGQAREKAQATWNKLKSKKVTKNEALKIAAGAAGIAGIVVLAKKLAT